MARNKKKTSLWMEMAKDASLWGRVAVILGVVAVSVAIVWNREASVSDSFWRRQNQKTGVEVWLRQAKREPLDYRTVFESGAWSEEPSPHIGKTVFWPLYRTKTVIYAQSDPKNTVMWSNPEQLPEFWHHGYLDVVARVRWVYPGGVLLEYLGYP